ncbi:MAG TPA: hypothetical protein VFR23_24740 [Jiangellaceae bacterium]|nr:hypothetical protein [Jiangellaceae bacterium]
MAFTAAQKVSIRTYLCFPLGFYDLNTRLESMMDTVGGDANAQTHVEGLLTKLAAVETAIQSTGSSSSTQGALKAITGDVEWYEPSESGGSTVSAHNYGKILINRLAACFGFRTDELPANFFAAASSAGNEMALG